MLGLGAPVEESTMFDCYFCITVLALAEGESESLQIERSQRGVAVAAVKQGHLAMN